MRLAWGCTLGLSLWWLMPSAPCASLGCLAQPTPDGWGCPGSATALLRGRDPCSVVVRHQSERWCLCKALSSPRAACGFTIDEGALAALLSAWVTAGYSFLPAS